MPEGSSGFGLMLPEASPAGRRLPPSPRRRLGMAAGASLLLHVVLLAALLAGMTRQRRIVVAGETPAIVELVMSPPGTSRTTTPATAPPHVARPKPVSKPAIAAPAPAPPHVAPKQPAPAGKPVEAAVPPAPAPTKAPAIVTANSAPPQPSPPEVAPAAHAASPAPPLPAKPKAGAAPPPAEPPSVPAATPDLQLSLGGIASDTNALVTGSMLLPPTADPKFHNRKPSYPAKAALLGEQGTVLLLIHVSPEGLVTGVDIAQSSGYRLLDRSARDTVLTWHFLPAIRHGQPVRFDMPMRIVFALD